MGAQTVRLRVVEGGLQLCKELLRRESSVRRKLLLRDVTERQHAFFHARIHPASAPGQQRQDCNKRGSRHGKQRHAPLLLSSSQHGFEFKSIASKA